MNSPKSDSKSQSCADTELIAQIGLEMETRERELLEAKYCLKDLDDAFWDGHETGAMEVGTEMYEKGYASGYDDGFKSGYREAKASSREYAGK